MPDPAALQACHDALEACLAANAESQPCFVAERGCVGEAFRATFEAACAVAQAACAAGTAEAQVCARITERCTQGVAGRTDPCAP